MKLRREKKKVGKKGIPMESKSKWNLDSHTQNWIFRCTHTHIYSKMHAKEIENTQQSTCQYPTGNTYNLLHNKWTNTQTFRHLMRWCFIHLYSSTSIVSVNSLVFILQLSNCLYVCNCLSLSIRLTIIIIIRVSIYSSTLRRTQIT